MNAGVLYRATVPGSGAVFLDVGRIVTDQAGTIVNFPGDLEGLCAALE